ALQATHSFWARSDIICISAAGNAALTLRVGSMTISSNPSVMDKLTINVPGAPAAEIELKPGVNRLGRSNNTDFQISHPSVSGAHCEIMAKDGAWVVKDLGSTNGTLLDGTPVRESAWQRGQTLRLGEVEIVFTPESA